MWLCASCLFCIHDDAEVTTARTPGRPGKCEYAEIDAFFSKWTLAMTQENAYQARRPRVLVPCKAAPKSGRNTAPRKRATNLRASMRYAQCLTHASLYVSCPEIGPTSKTSFGKEERGRTLCIRFPFLVPEEQENPSLLCFEKGRKLHFMVKCGCSSVPQTSDYG